MPARLSHVASINTTGDLPCCPQKSAPSPPQPQNRANYGKAELTAGRRVLSDTLLKSHGHLEALPCLQPHCLGCQGLACARLSCRACTSHRWKSRALLTQLVGWSHLHLRPGMRHHCKLPPRPTVTHTPAYMPTCSDPGQSSGGDRGSWQRLDCELIEQLQARSTSRF